MANQLDRDGSNLGKVLPMSHNTLMLQWKSHFNAVEVVNRIDYRVKVHDTLVHTTSTC